MPECDETQAPETPPALIDWEALALMAEEFDTDEFDEPVQDFLRELQNPQRNEALLREAATLLLQDEVDFSPEFSEMGIEPDEALVELFLMAGADPNERNPYGDLPLCLAASYGYGQIVDMLLDAGAKPSLANAMGKYPADVAANPELIDKLMVPETLQTPIDDEADLPAFALDADAGIAPDDDFFAPQHDCGLGDCSCKK